MVYAEQRTGWDATLLSRVEEACRRAGFDVSGVAPAKAAEDAQRFVEWIEAGRAGEMEWLKRTDAGGVLVRSAVQVAMPWARSVVVCALNYNAEGPHSLDPASAGAGWIGRYAWSGREAGGEIVPSDYHDDLLVRLEEVEAEIQRNVPCQTRCYVDTGPLVERSVAVKAGVGWIGKNTCVLREGVGSWLLLGVIVTSLDFSPQMPMPVLAADRCGSCTRCLDACPTGALVAARQMDASLCIAYLTIEKKGEIAEHLREGMGRQVFGCDICQDVCPWNRRAPIAETTGFATRPELVNPSLAELATLDGPAFRRLFRGSPLERTGRRRLQRNVAIAMGNSGEASFIPQLQAWGQGDDVVLSASALWALNRLGEPPSALLTSEVEPTDDADQPER